MQSFNLVSTCQQGIKAEDGVSAVNQDFVFGSQINLNNTLGFTTNLLCSQVLVGNLSIWGFADGGGGGSNPNIASRWGFVTNAQVNNDLTIQKANYVGTIAPGTNPNSVNPNSLTNDILYVQIASGNIGPSNNVGNGDLYGVQALQAPQGPTPNYTF